MEISTIIKSKEFDVVMGITIAPQGSGLVLLEVTGEIQARFAGIGPGIYANISPIPGDTATDFYFKLSSFNSIVRLGNTFIVRKVFPASRQTNYYFNIAKDQWTTNVTEIQLKNIVMTATFWPSS